MDNDVEMKEVSPPPSCPWDTRSNSSIRSKSPSTTSTSTVSSTTSQPEKTKRKKKKKTTKFIPPRYPLACSPPSRDDFDAFQISIPKVADAKQDAEFKRNKHYVFELDGLKHRDTSEIWIGLNGLLFALGYGTHRGLQSGARKVYLDSLEHWLHESCLTHPLSMFHIRFGNMYWVSKEGFSIMIPILNSYERSNNMVKHVVEHRFQYLELFYKFRLVTEAGPYVTDPHNYMCTFCCLEDIPDQFDQICDCNVQTHLRCPVAAKSAIPRTAAAKKTYFCDHCVKLLPIDKLMSRRENSKDGVYEVDSVLGYNDMKYRRDGLFPFGAYFIQWQDYPLEACEYVELTPSFVPLVEQFWERQKTLEGGQVYQEKARLHLRDVINGEIEEQKQAKSKRKKATKAKKATTETTQKKKKKKGRKRKLGDLDADDVIVVEDMALTAIGSKGKAYMNSIRPPKRRRIDAEARSLGSLTSSESPDVVGSLSSLDLSSASSLRQVKGNGTYMPVSLFDAMNPGDIIRRQRFTHTARNVRDEKIAAYRQALKAKTSRRLTIILKRQYGGPKRLPKMVLESDPKEYPMTEDLESQVLGFLGRDWTEWKHDTSQTCFEVGEIIDLENPAKKYSDQSIDASRVFGLFACQPVTKGTILLEYVGVVSTAHEAEGPLGHILHELDQTTLMDLKGPSSITNQIKARNAKERKKRRKRKGFFEHDEYDSDEDSYWGPDSNLAMVVDPHVYHNEAVYMNDYRDNVEDLFNEVKQDDSSDEEDEYEFDDKKDRSEDGLEILPKKKKRRKQNVKFIEVNVNGWPHVFAVACRNIKPGQELLTDYGGYYWMNFLEITKRQKEIDEARADDAARFEKKFGQRKAECEKILGGLRELLGNVSGFVGMKCPDVLEKLPANVRKLVENVGATTNNREPGKVVMNVNDDVEMTDVSA